MEIPAFLQCKRTVVRESSAFPSNQSSGLTGTGHSILPASYLHYIVSCRPLHVALLYLLEYALPPCYPPHLSQLCPWLPSGRGARICNRDYLILLPSALFLEQLHALRSAVPSAPVSEGLVEIGYSLEASAVSGTTSVCFLGERSYLWGPHRRENFFWLLACYRST